MAQNIQKTKIVYVTSSDFKKEENRAFVENSHLSNGDAIKDLFEFEFRDVSIKEVLEVDLRVMVQAEVALAYSQIRVPCIVEHAGLVFYDYKDRSYPGGLTKPMWDTLKDDFVSETKSENRKAIARAVVAYCDGMKIKTFVGETHGIIARRAAGDRKFYWDTIFMPDDDEGNNMGMTYAELVENPSYGLEYKVKNLSQSTKAMVGFLEYIQSNPNPSLWSS